MIKQKILIVDDEPSIQELIRFNLEQAGFETAIAADGFAALEMYESYKPDLIVLDLMLPGKDGYDVCKEIRRNSNVPIIMLTAKETELERVLGLELGADDYMTKPFSPLELVARIKAVLRRASGQESQDENEYKVGNIHLQVDTREVRVNDQLVELTRKEFDLLHIFMQNVGKVMTREVLLQKVWGYEYEGETRTVDVHIRHLRRKLGPEGESRIETIHGVGYKLRGN
ncbi:MAG: response regulator transcription factor [Limnochordia bacterium]|mgnify:FL=1|jgi:two-component system alkaline phosphatase synthesis response regulator PhoP|nr:response regulator transcription factor [Limnochordia bacterium]MDI9465316.1 response regulator transcription factor [Bacillota bacterium]HAI52719.1 DNA-binding response regulator [Bacillota bacterium]HAN94435.1 DNA-binding response regulator [Bacillota bacterium]HOB40919.1 response regulator transcription factor [Limnochordia bacterium]